MQFSLIAGSLLVAVAQALQITGPPKGNLDQSKGVTVTWSRVSTDPSTAHLVLKRQSGGLPEYYFDFGVVDLSTGSYKVSASLPTGDDFQFAFISVIPQNTGTLALSEQLNITGAASGAAVTLPAGSASVSTSGTIPAGSAATGTGAGSASTATTVSTSTSTSTSTSSSGSGTRSGSSTATSSGAVSTTTHNAGNTKNAGGASMLALLIGAAAAMI